ncbi:TetR/AcrR family transcriptional regulator [Mycolicibacterium sp. 050232]|uniref:TetR/AcrR family transcriptional regulator n=1 Tax=Mycolicibacterium sp. 050232 TaxID=3113982 RepID=UPI002E2B2F50|nr:TetR/AcrR family transcriptional regulator [Mycolicibacterium sp. 050232]MED5812606.1 TetR/AcrR family transcriptional regulator [Mycolicibacterium sp. 050232]
MAIPQLGRPVGANGEETRARIIAATMHCVAEVGYARTTIREIARTAGITSANLYNYFPNKSELMTAAIAARAELALPRLRAAAQGPGNAVDRIDAVLDESGRLMREYPELAAFEWAIRGQSVVAVYPDSAGDGGFQALREIVKGVVDDAYPNGGALRDAAVEAIYALVYGLTELAATQSPQTYQRALNSAKQMIRGTLFVHP